MVDYSKWDRLDLGDSDSDAGEAKGAWANEEEELAELWCQDETLRKAFFEADNNISGATRGEDDRREGPSPPPNQPGENILSREKDSERQLRSHSSQQRRCEKKVSTKACEHCGADDYHYKLQVCSGCNLALYCSATCQKAASTSHRRICDIISMLPPVDSDRLALNYDREKMVDLDAGLRYATKYMANLKHLQIGVKAMKGGDEDALKLSAKRLSSLLRSKKGALDSVTWAQSGHHFPGENSYEVWKELHGLKQLHLYDMRFDDVQHICNIVRQQKDTLMVLCLPWLEIDWRKAKGRRALAQAINSCKHLVKLDLRGCVLVDADLKFVLQDLPNLRILSLKRDTHDSHELTDNTCGLIARKCPGLQELNLSNHNQLSVKGIRKIFEGCVELRSFYTTTRKLSGTDIQTLLDCAPQLLHLFLDVGLHISVVELSGIIEATGGRIVFQWSDGDLFQPNSVSVKTGETYGRQFDELNKIWSSGRDPVVANEWADCLMGPPPIDEVS